MVRMGVVEADNVLSALASITLDTDEFLGVDVVAIVRRIVASVAGARDAGYGFGTVARKLAEQHTAAFVRVGFFAALTKRIVDVAGNSEHRKFKRSDCRGGELKDLNLCNLTSNL